MLQAHTTCTVIFRRSRIAFRKGLDQRNSQHVGISHPFTSTHGKNKNKSSIKLCLYEGLELLPNVIILLRLTSSRNETVRDTALGAAAMTFACSGLVQSSIRSDFLSMLLKRVISCQARKWESYPRRRRNLCHRNHCLHVQSSP